MYVMYHYVQVVCIFGSDDGELWIEKRQVTRVDLLMYIQLFIEMTRKQ